MLKKYITKNFKQTQKLGEELAKEILLSQTSQKTAIVIGLSGNLGGGKTTFLQGFAKGLGIKTDPTGRPVVKDCTTTASNVFAAGDLVSGASYVVTAIASGRKTAEKINEYLAKIPATQSAASEAKA